MRKRFICCLTIILAGCLAAAAINLQLGFIRTARPLAAPPAMAAPRLTVVLVPLDSRPPCTQFVEQLAGLADVRLLLPPPELLDHYRTPANKAGLRAWLRKTAVKADAAIIATDMLVHGGLLASRLASGTAADADATLALLTDLHQANPQLKLYAFNIIPRLLLADGAASARFQKNMLKYSVLKDEVLTFENPLEREKLDQLAAQIPPELVDRYLTLYEANTQFNFRLVAMAESGVLSGLVFGQDDGYPFGLPNMVKSRLSHYINHRPELAEKVFITRGTDEVALTLLGRVVSQATGYEPRVFVRYSSDEAPAMVMPFMPHSVARTVEEKLRLVGGKAVTEAGQSDFVLYVHIGTTNTGPPRLTAAARDVKLLLAAGYRVGVVDLSEHFYAHETLLPYLLQENVDLIALAAYAGWNTTSNSVGTAVTQAALYSGALTAPGAGTLVQRKNQLEFLVARLLDDWYYQKDVQPYVNGRLRKLNIDPYNLGSSFLDVDNWIRGLMAGRAEVLFRQVLADRPIAVRGEGGEQRLIVTGLKLESRLPWQRTFEVWLQPSLSFAVLED